MNDSLFARYGYDPVRIHTLIHGHPPAPGGIARLGGPPPEAEPAPAPPDSPPLPGEGSEA